jgi:hypothetical protein
VALALVKEKMMKRIAEAPAKFRVKDWVSVLYGPRLVLAQIIEDRGPLGHGGQRVYRIRLERRQEEPTISETTEEFLHETSEADRIAWQTHGSLGIEQLVAYRDKDEDKEPHGLTFPEHYYLIVAKPGPRVGSGMASIFSLSRQDPTNGMSPSLSTLIAPTGGAVAALAKAEEYLDAQHVGLKKVIVNRRP